MTQIENYNNNFCIVGDKQLENMFEKDEPSMRNISPEMSKSPLSNRFNLAESISKPNELQIQTLAREGTNLKRIAINGKDMSLNRDLAEDKKYKSKNSFQNPVSTRRNFGINNQSQAGDNQEVTPGTATPE